MWKLIIATLLFLSIRAYAQSCTSTINVATLNTLQIEFAPYRGDRLQATANYFENRQTDLQVLCLQELWNPSDRTYIINQLNGEYPYSYYAPQYVQQTCTGGCTSSEISSVRDCINNIDCSNLDDGESFSDCVTSRCRNNLEGLSSSCIACLLQGENLSGSLSNLGNCLNDNNNNNNNSQTCYAFGGWSDNLILSKIPFVTQDYIRYNQSPITYTTALYVQLDAPNVGRVDFFCTHLLPADLPVLNYEQANNLNQTQELLNWAYSKTRNVTTITILAGDFNQGPGEFGSNYDYVIGSGYSSAYITAGGRDCTYCNSNPISTGDLTAIIDHIYVYGGQVSSTSRFATYDEYNTDRSGSNKKIPISDHYGVRANICPGITQPGVFSSLLTVQDTGADLNSSAFMLIPVIAFIAITLLL